MMKHHSLIVLSLILLTSGIGIKSNAQTIAWRNVQYMDFNYFNPACTFADTTHQYQVSTWMKYRFQAINVSGEHPLDAGADFQGRVNGHPEWSYSTGYTWDGYSFLNLHQVYGSVAYQWNWGIRSLSLGTRMRIYSGKVLWDNLAVPFPYQKHPLYVFPDMDFGLQYHVKDFSIRFSCLNAFSPKVGPDSVAVIHCERRFVIDNRFDCSIADKVTVVPHFLLSFGGHTVWAQLGLYFDILHQFHLSADLCGADLNQVYAIGCDLPLGLSIDAAFQYAPFHDDFNLDVKLAYRFNTKKR